MVSQCSCYFSFNKWSFSSLYANCLSLVTEYLIDFLCTIYELLTVSESDWLYSNLDQHLRCQLVTEKLIHSFSVTLRLTDLQRIAEELNFSHSELGESWPSDPQAVSLQAFKLLSEWTASEGGKATVANFVQKMRSAGVADDTIKSVVLHNCSQ